MPVQLEFLHPAEIETAQATCPTLFLPLGTIEWHGFHNVTGLDALKAHALCVHAAEQGGGLVHPPLYGGVGGLEEPHTFVFDPEDSIGSVYLRPWLEQLISEAARNGFEAVIVLTGHYGAAQQIAVREAAVRMSRVLDIPVLGTAEYWLALDEDYTGDHAAFFETSLMMHLHPDTVKLDRLVGAPPYQGVGGRDPKAHATAAEGRRFADAIVRRLAALATAMPAWDDATRGSFVAAEAALVNRQLDLAGRGHAVWTAWRKVGEGHLRDYPAALVEGRFADIERMAAEL
jgi:creatinine amidohydrolase